MGCAVFDLTLWPMEMASLHTLASMELLMSNYFQYVKSVVLNALKGNVPVEIIHGDLHKTASLLKQLNEM